MNESDELLSTFGIIPPTEKRQEILALLLKEIDNEDSESNEYLKTLCILLFSIGNVQDAINIWKAKSKNFDAGAYIDVQLLVGAGLDETKAYLLSVDDRNAKEAYDYLIKCEKSGDFIDFNNDKYLESIKRYFRVE